ncbi:MAG TPA: hypothetical protein VKT82_26650 [Ktedonobacterales bacterium]|nr:hypothetical protein [Ktedonobacterales bacterium]
MPARHPLRRQQIGRSGSPDLLAVFFAPGNNAYGGGRLREPGSRTLGFVSRARARLGILLLGT